MSSASEVKTATRPDRRTTVAHSMASCRAPGTAAAYATRAGAAGSRVGSEIPPLYGRLRCAGAHQLSSSSMRNPRIIDGLLPIGGGDGACGQTGAIGWLMVGDICCWLP